MNARSRLTAGLSWVAAAMLLPLIPPGTVLVLGWLLPGRIPWFYADAAVPVGALLSVSAVTYLLTRCRGYAVVRLLILLVVVAAMSFFARIELVFTVPCVTQRGILIDFQRQQSDREANLGPGCGT